MHRRSLAVLAAVLSAAAHAQTPGTRSDKRGLVFVPSKDHPEDNEVWVRDGSDLTWYYNYSPSPAPAYAGQAQGDFEFVPMLFGSIDDTSFLDTVTGLLDGGRNVTHVLTFNEPDGSTQTGGSNLYPWKAAQVWVDNIIPLQAKGVKAGLPGCTGGPGGIPWLREFLGNCSQLISTGGTQRNCSYDFVSIHWYGNFEGLASHLGEYSAAFPNKTQWITEYNFDHQDLATTQGFYRTSAEYFDRLDSVARYSYFGSFRSRVSNVGPNAVMLSNGGELTDIGSWYLGGAATGVDPQSGRAARGRASLLLAFASALVGGLFVL
ncbi:putative glycoside catalytic core protein [Rosellinia necatrix]|uniref:Putative glycoside catalytic core protein n=1 Tax=Rosellinia necatrix TaxID=77044 RepID=A0A1W2TFY4_ROSNE|nr:putative glycoside catalytic core protein [Rosellinia necatrix]